MDYTRTMPRSLLVRAGGTTQYVTLLRQPIRRLMSEYFWGCGAKVNNRFGGTEHEGKVLFDWPRRLWREIPIYCWQKFPAKHQHLAKGNKTTGT
mmetsp:Transcript_33862/g.78200  ORF Transcript_33862/g.78200 Transcript_33862/m.78200 type:complete len:94 (-) Transcript_33862:15-296(-)